MNSELSPQEIHNLSIYRDRLMARTSDDTLPKGRVIEEGEEYQISELIPKAVELDILSQNMYESANKLAQILYDDPHIKPDSLIAGGVHYGQKFTDELASPWGDLKVQYNDDNEEERESITITTTENVVDSNGTPKNELTYLATIYLANKFDIRELSKGSISGVTVYQSETFSQINKHTPRLLKRADEIMNFYMQQQELAVSS